MAAAHNFAPVSRNSLLELFMILAPWGFGEGMKIAVDKPSWSSRAGREPL
jgi:hypothetical protein